MLLASATASSGVRKVIATTHGPENLDLGDGRRRLDIGEERRRIEAARGGQSALEACQQLGTLADAFLDQAR